MCDELKLSKVQKMTTWRWNWQRVQTSSNQFMGLGFGNFFLPTNKMVIIEKVNAVLVPNVFFGNSFNADLDYYLTITMNLNRANDYNWNYFGETNMPSDIFPENEAYFVLNKNQNTIDGLKVPADVVSVAGLVQARSFSGLPVSLDLDIRVTVLYRDIIE